MYRTITLAGFLFLSSCTTSTTTQPATTRPVIANPEFKNLQVLPPDITRDQLMATMRSFTRGLGVRCNHCHVVTATDRKSTRLNSSHLVISYAVFCLKKKKKKQRRSIR